jgi:hypothetical protein
MTAIAHGKFENPAGMVLCMSSMVARALVVLAVVLGACDYHPAGRSNPETALRVLSGASIETVVVPDPVSGLQFVAGQSVHVTCAVTQGGDMVRDLAYDLDVTPDVDTVEGDGNKLTFVPSMRGSHTVRCRTSDGSLAEQLYDAVGVDIVVVPSIKKTTDTVLAVTSAQAGAPVEVYCPLYDAYGNEVEGEADGVVAPSVIDIEPTTGPQFVARGSVIGAFDIACKSGSYVDPTPARLTVVTGVPGKSATTVSSASVAPGEAVNVGCAVSDAFGNPISGAQTSFYVIAADGTYPSTSGLVLGSSSWSATRAGSYYVFCVVPEFHAGDETPAVVEVHPGLPYSWVTDLLEQECYWENRPLPFDYVVYDYWGNELGRPPVEAYVNGTRIYPDDEGRFWIDGEGAFDLEFAVAAPTHDDIDIPRVLHTVLIDSTPPIVTFSTPGRGAFLTAGTLADTTVALQGSVFDTTTPVTSVVINGSTVAVTPGSSSVPFSLTKTARWGVNVVTAEVSDACGNRGVIAQSFVRSAGHTDEVGNNQPGYFSAATTLSSSARARSGLLARLNQTVIDDANRGDLDDVASMAQAMLRAQDFDGMIAPGQLLATDPMGGSCSGCFAGRADTAYDVWRSPDTSKHVNWTGPNVNSLSAVNGGLSFSISLFDFDFPLRMRLREKVCSCAFCVCASATNSNTVDAWAGADRVDATGVMSVSLAGGVPTVNVTSVNLSTSGMYFSPSCGWAQFICDAISGLVVSLVRNQIEDALESVIRAELPPIVKGFLSDFRASSSFFVPAPMSMSLNLSSGLDYLRFCGPNAGVTTGTCSAATGFGELGLYGQVFPSAKGLPPTIPTAGAIRKDGVFSTFSATAYQFGLGVKDDLLNQIFWAIWYGGGLSLSSDDVEALTDTSLEGVDLSLQATTPPIVMPGRNGNEVEIGLGDAYIDADVDLSAILGGPSSAPMHVGLYLSTIVGGSIDIDPTNNELQAVLDANPQVWVQVVDIDDPGYQAVMSEFFTELLRLVLPQMLTHVLGEFPIPEFQLGGLAGLPAGTVLRLGNASADRSGDYYRLVGVLR